MTVHGAKGLEADVVFLVDTGGLIVVPNQRETLVAIGKERDDPAFIWRRRKEEAPAVQSAADAVADEETAAEYLRLLYVAMTRARDVLYVAGIQRASARRRIAGTRWSLMRSCRTVSSVAKTTSSPRRSNGRSSSVLRSRPKAPPPAPKKRPRSFRAGSRNLRCRRLALRSRSALARACRARPASRAEGAGTMPGDRRAPSRNSAAQASGNPATCPAIGTTAGRRAASCR